MPFVSGEAVKEYLRNVAAYCLQDTASYSKRIESVASPLREIQITFVRICDLETQHHSLSCKPLLTDIETNCQENSCVHFYLLAGCKLWVHNLKPANR
jgi:hypothetical protein